MLAATPVAGVGAAQGDGGVALPRLPALEVSSALPRLQRALAPLGGRRALVTLVLGVFLVVVFATAGASALVPTSSLTYPTWEAGPQQPTGPPGSWPRPVGRRCRSWRANSGRQNWWVGNE